MPEILPTARAAYRSSSAPKTISSSAAHKPNQSDKACQMRSRKKNHDAPCVSKNASRNPSADSKCARCRAWVIRGAFASSPSKSRRRPYLQKKLKKYSFGLDPAALANNKTRKKKRLQGERHSHRSCNAVASPARKSVVPVCEARLTAQQPRCGSAVSADVVVGSRSVLLSRMNVCGVTSGASSAGISSRGPGGVVETASGNESTRSEASAASTLGNI
jgi:hypothetical protein